MKALFRCALLLAATLFLLVSPLQSDAQTFVIDTLAQQNMLGTFEGSIDWGDYDKDGDLDVLVTGFNDIGTSAKVYRNTLGYFTDIQAPLQDVVYSTAKWADIDNDGDLDIALVGRNGNAFTKLYRNDNGNFIDQNVALTPMDYADLTWGDYDNDGDADLVMQGWAGIHSDDSTKLYRNDAGTFVDAHVNLPGLDRGAPKWADYDNDGDLDLLLTGYNSNQGAQLYRNDAGTFVATGISFGAYQYDESDWGDYDSDGDLDLAMSGRFDPPGICKVFRNDGGSFSAISSTFQGIANGAVRWGDYDNDGDLDLLTTGGYAAGTSNTRLYVNTNGIFTGNLIQSAYLSGSRATWSDYDNDGDLDIDLLGYDANNSNYVNLPMKNTSLVHNTPPNAPTGFTATNMGAEILFSWDPATDAQTPSDGLSYQLWIGNASNLWNVAPALADTVTGWRRVAARGDIQGTSWVLKNIAPGVTYRACVSAIDGGFMGSPCSQQLSLVAITDAEAQPSIVVAGPNPTGGMLHVATQGAAALKLHYQLSDLQGREIAGMNGHFAADLDLDLSSLPAGVYLLQLTATDIAAAQTLRIVKE